MQMWVCVYKFIEIERKGRGKGRIYNREEECKVRFNKNLGNRELTFSLLQMHHLCLSDIHPSVLSFFKDP